MQIDRLNFKDHYQHIVKTIQNCDLISFDCEFTGLITQLKKIEGTFPDHNEYYQRIKETALNFKIIQLGLTAFTFNQNGQYVPQSFNFYLTPFVTVENYNNVMIGEVQSLQFLANHGLDFERVFTKGLIPQRILKPFIYKQHQYQNRAPSFNNDFFFNQQDQKTVDKIQNQLSQMKGSNKFQKIDFKSHAIMTFITNKHSTSLYLKKEKKLLKYEFLVKVHDVELANETIQFQNQQKEKKISNQVIKQQKNIPLAQDKKQQEGTNIQKLPITNINQAQTKIVQKIQQIAKEIKQQEQSKQIKINQTQQLKQAKMNNLSLKKQQQQKVIKEQLKAQQVKQEQPVTYQISNIIKIILNLKKPLIGHFPCLDLGLIYHTFLEDLPENYADFCKTVNMYFSHIFDTKVISRRIQNQLKGIKVDLKSLYMACYNKKLLQPYSNIKFDQIQEYISSDSHHEAGYDSFITGCAFIGMANFLNNNDKQQKINFTLLQKENKVLYSRDVGEVSLCQPYCPKSLIYQKSILIVQMLKNETTAWKEAAKKLSKFGTLTVYQDHGQTYFVYEQQNQKIDEIILAHPQLKLKKYSKRKMIKSRQMYKGQ